MKKEVKKEELISIIIPVYKVEKYLPRCIDSILAQTYTNFELILVDDGSPDKCPQICDDYAKRDKRIRVIHKKNAGVSEARNTGIDNANGDFICFVDSDDYVEPVMYEKLYNSLIKNKSQMSMCGYNIVYENGKNVPFNEFIINSNDLCFSEIPDNMFVDNTFGSVCRTLYTKGLIGENRFSKDFYSGEDLLFNLSIIKKNTRISVVKDHLYNYFQRMDSCVHVYREDAYKHRIQMIKQVLPLVQDKISQKHYKAYSYRLYEFCVYDCLFAKKYVKLLKEMNNNDFVKSLRIKENYELKKAEEDSKLRRLVDYLIFKKRFRTLKFLHKMKSVFN